LVAALLLAGERLRERAPERRLAAERKLLPESAPETLEVAAAAQADGSRLVREGGLELLHVEGQLQGAAAELHGAGLGERTAAGRAELAVDRPHEHDRDLLSLQP